MKIFLTGATGFVGSALVKELLQEGHELSVLRRDKSDRSSDNPHLVYIEGDILKPQAWSHHVKGIDAVINLVGIIRELRGMTFEKLHVEGTSNMIKVCKDKGVARYLHMSANGVAEGIDTGYYRTKYRAEEIVKNSGLDYTIFRPSLIFGPQDSLTTMLLKYMKVFHVFPSFGKGTFELQPIYVKDVAKVFSYALEHGVTSGRILHLGGPEVFQWINFLKTLAAAAHIKCLFIPVPLGIVSVMAKLFGRFSFFPLTEDQLKMLLGGNITPYNDASDILKEKLHALRPTLESYYNPGKEHSRQQ